MRGESLTVWDLEDDDDEGGEGIAALLHPEAKSPTWGGSTTLHIRTRNSVSESPSKLSPAKLLHRLQLQDSIQTAFVGSPRLAAAPECSLCVTRTALAAGSSQSTTQKTCQARTSAAYNSVS